MNVRHGGVNVGQGRMFIKFASPLPSDDWRAKFCWLAGDDCMAYDLKKFNCILTQRHDGIIVKCPVAGVVYFYVQMMP